MNDQIIPPYSRSKYSSKAQIYSSRFTKLNQTTSECIAKDEMLTMHEAKIGVGDNAIVLGDGSMKLMNSEDSLKLDFNTEAISMQSNSIKLDTDFSKVIFEGGKAMNPMLKTRPPNVVNYYAPVITVPPGVATGLVRGITGVIMGILEVYRSYKESQNNAGQD